MIDRKTILAGDKEKKAHYAALLHIFSLGLHMPHPQYFSAKAYFLKALDEQTIANIALLLLDYPAPYRIFSLAKEAKRYAEMAQEADAEAKNQSLIVKSYKSYEHVTVEDFLARA